MHHWDFFLLTCNHLAAFITTALYPVIGLDHRNRQGFDPRDRPSRSHQAFIKIYGLLNRLVVYFPKLKLPYMPYASFRDHQLGDRHACVC